MGDPAGIGPEVLIKSLVHLRHWSALKRLAVTVVGDLNHLRQLANRLGLSVPWDRFQWHDLGNLSRGIRPGQIQVKAAKAAWACLEEAVRQLQAGHAHGLVTAPVSKEAMVRAGLPWVGHTEYLACRFHSQTAMLLVTGRVRIALVTTHLPLRQVARRLTADRITFVLKATHRALIEWFGILQPRLALAALNPHAGEGGMIGDEEKGVLLKALRLARSAHLMVSGPLPSDTAMLALSRGAFDAVVALYHDQALIPMKLLGWQKAVNLTLGLPFVRTSPVHGTAFDLAGRGEANPSSMMAALRLAEELLRRNHRGWEVKRVPDAHR